MPMSRASLSGSVSVGGVGECYRSTFGSLYAPVKKLKNFCMLGGANSDAQWYCPPDVGALVDFSPSGRHVEREREREKSLH